MSGFEQALFPSDSGPIRLSSDAIHPVPEGPWPAGMAWYPLLGTWGPVTSLHGDIEMDDAAFFDPDDGIRDTSLDGDDLPPHLWRTFKGEIVQIKSLTTSHLRNILRLIERKNRMYTLAKLAECIPRVRCLTDEWLSRF